MAVDKGKRMMAWLAWDKLILKSVGAAWVLRISDF